MVGKIFINYRRGDDPGFAQALFAHLAQAFTPEQLFMDVDSIEPGLDFVRVLNDQVAQCDILLSVVGKDWTDARDENGARRLDNRDDFVRVEIEAALQQDKRVIPVLVGQAHMPRADQLPDTMKPFARRNAVRLTHERFRADTQALITALQRALKGAEDARAAAAEGARRREAEQAEAQTREPRLPTGAEPSLAGSRRTAIIATGVALVLLAVGGAIVFKNYQPAGPPEIGAGELTITGPHEPGFAGQQGGPFSPASISLQLKAVGGPFHWSTVGATAAWLNIVPDQGDLTADGSTQLTLTLTPAAQSLAPDRYESHILLKNHSSGVIVASNVSVAVAEKGVRVKVGCPAATVEKLNPDISLAELQCVCFNKCEPSAQPQPAQPKDTSPARRVGPVRLRQ